MFDSRDIRPPSARLILRSVLLFCSVSISSHRQCAQLYASKHLSVQDFSHIRATPSPNWTALPEPDIIVDENWPLKNEGMGSEEVNAVLPRLLPAVLELC